MIDRRTPTIGTTVHVPIVPAWTCAGCTHAWPCPTRQRQLLAEYDGARISLGLLVSSFFVIACQDLPNALAGELHERFFGWTRTNTMEYLGY